MEKEHIKQLSYMLSMYGTAPVMKAMAEELEEKAKDYTEGAIIFENIPIVREASRKLNELKYGRISLTFPKISDTVV